MAGARPDPSGAAAAERIDGRTRVVGVFGDPVEHSLSPPMHNRAFAALGLNFVYVAFHVRPERLPEAVRAVRALDLAGVNVTIPHKVAVMAHLDEVDPAAALIGAVNTVVNRGGRLYGTNTDGAGFVRSLREEAGLEPAGRRFVLLGAGGAARAIAMQLALDGAAELTIANRTVDRAEALAAAVTKGLAAVPGARGTGPVAGTAPVVRAVPLEPGALQGALAEADAVIHTTPVGMDPHSDVPPVVAPELLRPGQLVCDIVYTPRQTALLRAARARGCRVLEGLGMLVYQGAIAFELFTGCPAPVEVMRQALEEALARRRG